jgi:hypothetical protein
MAFPRPLALLCWIASSALANSIPWNSISVPVRRVVMVVASVAGRPAGVGHIRAEGGRGSKAIRRGSALISRNVGNFRPEVTDTGLRAGGGGRMSEQAPSPGAPAAPPRLNPAALSTADASRLLSAMGNGEVTEEMLRADIGAGAPANADGTVNLVHYAAWLVRQAAEAGRGD